MDAKQYTAKQLIDHWRNHRKKTNKQKNTDKWKQKQKMKTKTAIQNPQNSTKAVLRGKFIAIQSYIMKQDNSNLTSNGSRKRKTNKTLS